MTRVYQSVCLPFLFVSLTTAGYVGIPPDRNNEASAIINLSRNLGGSIGVAAATTELAWRIQVHHERLGEQVSTIGARGQQLTQHGLAAAQQLVTRRPRCSATSTSSMCSASWRWSSRRSRSSSRRPRLEKPMATELPPSVRARA